jgi:hypothetical protein
LQRFGIHFPLSGEQQSVAIMYLLSQIFLNLFPFHLINEFSYTAYKVIFQVLKAARVMTDVFWVVAPCSLVKSTDVLEVRAASIIGTTS